jgi:signal transduction histidine kinase
LIMIYTGGYLFFGAYAAAIRQAENARRENERLVDELQAAHRQLQAYASRAEESAVLQERNRLARGLHDSVSQTVFGMTMLVEAVRILFDRDMARAASQLDKLQELAQSALGEMRTLIFELRTSDGCTRESIPVEVSTTTGGQGNGSD